MSLDGRHSRTLLSMRQAWLVLNQLGSVERWNVELAMIPALQAERISTVLANHDAATRQVFFFFFFSFSSSQASSLAQVVLIQTG